MIGRNQEETWQNFLVEATRHGHLNEDNDLRKLLLRGLKSHKDKVQESKAFSQAASRTAEINPQREQSSESSEEYKSGLNIQGNRPIRQDQAPDVQLQNLHLLLAANQYLSGFPSHPYPFQQYPFPSIPERSSVLPQRSTSSAQPGSSLGSSQLSQGLNPGNDGLAQTMMSLFEDLKSSLSTQILNLQRTQAQNSNAINPTSPENSTIFF